MPRYKKKTPADSPQHQVQAEESNMATAQDPEPAVSAELQQALRALLNDDMRQMMETVIGKALESFKKSLELLELHSGDHKKRILELETGLSGYSDRMAALEGMCKKVAAENKALLSRAEEAEDRSRRFNLRVTNIDEKYLEEQNATQFMSKFFAEVLGDVFPSPPVLDIAYRVGQLRRDGKPRVMIVKFHYLQDKVRALAANRNQLEWRGEKVRFFADYSPATSKQHASYAKVKLLLFNKKVKFRLVYPAVLRVEHENLNYSFKSAEEAQRFCDQHFPTGQ